MKFDEPKVTKAIIEHIEPLFDVWKRDACLNEEESIVLYHKLFDPEKPDDLTIRDILADKIDKKYQYYHIIKIRRIYKKARNKLNKILP